MKTRGSLAKALYVPIAVFFLHLSFGSVAQNRQPLDVLSTLNGLPTDEVTRIYQDKEGYIWVATYNGLCRYDGYRVKTYKSNLYTPGLLSNNKVNTVAEDDRNQLWIGTANGLDRLDKTTGIIRPVGPDKLVNTNIQAILPAAGHTVWIGTAGGLYKYEAERDTFLLYTNLNTGYQLPGTDIKTLIEDSRGNIWIGTWNDGITRYDPSADRFYHYPQLNPRNSAHVIFEDERKNIWVGSWGYGLFRLENPYSPEQVKYVRYLHSDSDPGSLSDNIVYALSEDLNTHSLWVGTRSGLSVLKSDGKSFVNYLPNRSGRSISYNEVNSIIRDRSGLMWLGTLGGGVSTVNTRKWMFNLNRLNEVKTTLSSNSVRSIYVDDNDIVWLGIGSFGLVAYDRNTCRYLYHKDHPDLRAWPIPTVTAIIRPGQATAYWFATYGRGIFVYDPAAGGDRVKNITAGTDAWLGNDCVFSLKEDMRGNVWIGTDDGLSIYDRRTGVGYAFPELGQKGGDFRYSVCSMETDRSGYMWVGTNDRGVFRVYNDPGNPENVKFYHYDTANGKVNSDHIQYLYRDSEDRLWLGTEGGGLSLYDPEKDTFVCMHETYNLPGDIIYNIVEDQDGNLWLGSNSGLLKLSFSGEGKGETTYRLYTTSDGLQDNSFNRNAVFKTKDGELFFGGHKGYNSFYPDRLQENDFISPVTITDVKIFNKSLELLGEKMRAQVSEKAPGFTAEIRLPYTYNNFSIEFTTLSFANPMQNKYAYRLANFDEEWQYTDASRRFAYYNNLKSGTYEFHIKASNENGIWNERPSVLRVVVLPPPWFTWWAFLIYLTVTVSAVYFYMRSVKSKMLLKNALRVRVLEQQKTEELNHAKLQFFTNITHEFLTPLTILSASLDELKLIAPQHNDFYRVMGRNVDRLIRLLQQILEFRKAETGNLKLRVSKSDIAAFVRTGVDSFRPLMKRNKIHFSLICDSEIIPAYFDPDKLDKILYNLLSNASKYNRAGGFVQVNVYYESGEKDRVVISVRDNGEGISPVEIKGLFKRFYEGDYRRFNTIGTGIGLSLTKDLVTLHRGEISVESEVGKGSVFYVKLPVGRGAYDPDQIDDYMCVPERMPVAHEEEEGEYEAEEPKEHTLLLVEDNDELRQLMVKLLHREYNVYTGKDGREGMRVLEEQDVDLIVSDIMMPGMDGIEFCRQVKNKFEISHIPVILLTAKNKEEDRIEAYESGADGFISKPFNLNLLHAKIRSLLKSRERTTQDFKKQFVFEIRDMKYTSVDEEFLQRAFDCVNRHLDDAGFDQLQFMEEIGASKSTLYKKLKSLTGLNTSAFIRNIRLKAACRIIEEKKKIRISELAYAVGFNDPKYFSACFKREFGMIPSEYLDKILEGEEEKIS